METYPIVLENKRAGTLEVERRGLMTVFSAILQDRGRLVRLSCYGEGREGYLGVMAPDGAGNITLRRSLSRADMRDFPKEIEYAAPAGEAIRRAVSGEEKKPDTAVRPERVEEPAASPETEEGDILWFSAPDGTLSTFDGKRSLIALPAEDARVPRGSEGIVRRINGQEYIVFPR